MRWLTATALESDILFPLVCAAVTGRTVYADNGLSIMGLAVDSKTLEREMEALHAAEAHKAPAI